MLNFSRKTAYFKFAPFYYARFDYRSNYIKININQIQTQSKPFLLYFLRKPHIIVVQRKKVEYHLTVV